jgi:hypothetical protein
MYRVEKCCEAMEEVHMQRGKSRFLLTTAVLLAGVSLASAQGMREGGGGGSMGAGGGPGAGAGTSAGGGARGGTVEQ